MSFAVPLKKMIVEMYCLPRNWQYYDSPEMKEKPLAELGGLSWRQALIEGSEKLVKPVKGRNFWALSGVQRVINACNNHNFDDKRGNKPWFFFTDTGFEEEYNEMCLAFAPRNVLVLQLEREGKSFANDSRMYVGCEANTVRIKNIEGKIDETIKKGVALCDTFLVN